MVVKVNENLPPSSSTQRTAQRVIKKYQNGPDTLSYSKLKRLVPAISHKENISKLDVVLEAINYIQTLQGNLRTGAAAAAATQQQQQQPDSRRCC